MTATAFYYRGGDETHESIDSAYVSTTRIEAEDI